MLVESKTALDPNDFHIMEKKGGKKLFHEVNDDRILNHQVLVLIMRFD